MNPNSQNLNPDHFRAILVQFDQLLDVLLPADRKRKHLHALVDCLYVREADELTLWLADKTERCLRGPKVKRPTKKSVGPQNGSPFEMVLAIYSTLLAIYSTLLTIY